MHHCIPHPTQHNRQRYFYWEAIECLRKSVLMGFAVFFQPGSLMQLVLVMVLTVLYGFILALLNPYKSAADDRLAITQQVLLFFTLLGGLMVKFQRGFKSTGLYEEGNSEEFISSVLTARSEETMLCVSVVQLLYRGAIATRTQSLTFRFVISWQCPRCGHQRCGHGGMGSRKGGAARRHRFAR